MIDDIVAPGLRVLFCGINPGKSSAHTGYHFAHPGNRFWKVIHLAGFTPSLLRPADEHQLLASDCGITMLVARPTVQAGELQREELRCGGEALTKKVMRWQPQSLAVLGKQAYEQAFGERNVKWGLQARRIEETAVWVLPNPSGLNRASLAELVEAYQVLNRSLDVPTEGD